MSYVRPPRTPVTIMRKTISYVFELARWQESFVFVVAPVAAKLPLHMCEGRVLT